MSLFDNLPQFPSALPDEDLALLGSLPLWPTEREVTDDSHAIAARLERKGLIKISRQKMDPAAHRPTWFAGRLPSSMVRLSSAAIQSEATP